MATNRLLCAGTVASAAAAGFLLASPVVNGHCHQQFPMSRQYAWSKDFYDAKFENMESAPYAYNSGGVKVVQDRARANTDPAVLREVGEGGLFPLYFLDLAENGNYEETNEVAKRHWVCGDPRLGFGEDDIKYSTPNGDWAVVDSFVSGQEIEIDVVIVYYHWGHFEFRLCDVSSDPDGVVTQECLNEYQLTRAYNRNDASAIDPNYPGRYYLDPPCRANEVEQNVSDNIPADPYNVKMRYKLPDIECEHCVLQMHYLTGNRCKHIGYDHFNPAEWNSECAPHTSQWIDTDLGVCGVAKTYPEEFWGCSDISITKSGGTQPAPVPAPVTPEAPLPVAPETPVPVTPETPSPVTPETPAPATPETPSPVPATETAAADDYDEEFTSDGVSYMGCWEDQREQRAMLIGYATPDGLSNEACIEFCAVDKNMFAGTMADFSCWCSNDEDRIYRHGESDQCTKPCSLGDTSQICGGSLALSVYTTGYIKPEAVVPDIDGATYLGCFADVRERRTMEIGFVNTDNLTNEECIDYCRDIGKPFAGVQNDSSCWCTDDEQKIDRNGDSDQCVKECAGDETQICGGRLAVTTWATGLAPSALDTAAETVGSTSEYTEAILSEVGGPSYEEEIAYYMPPAVPDIEGASYLGCFEDMRGERTMKIAYVNNDDMTNEECVEYCRMNGSSYAGTQNDYSCWCGDDSDLIARHGESDQCNRACTGDPSQVCGGLLAVTTWATGIEPDI